MIRSILSKVAWVGRTASMVFGLALILALLLGIATAGLAATGSNFILGKANTAGAVSKLSASVAGPALQLVNQSTASGATALGLNVASGKPPLKVNSGAGKATNLNADKLDGKDQSAFVPASRAPMWAVVNANGTIARKSPEVLSAQRDGLAVYRVIFNRNVDKCAFAATGYAFQDGPIVAVAGNLNGGLPGPGVRVVTFRPSGAGVDATFHLVVTC